MPKKPSTSTGKERLTRRGVQPQSVGGADTRVGVSSSRRQQQGWLSTRARTDLASVTVSALHALQKRIQNVIRRRNQGHEVSADDLQVIRESMLALWRDAKQYTANTVPLSYEEFVEMETKSALTSRASRIRGLASGSRTGHIP